MHLLFYIEGNGKEGKASIIKFKNVIYPSCCHEMHSIDLIHRYLSRDGYPWWIRDGSFICQTDYK